MVNSLLHPTEGSMLLPKHSPLHKIPPRQFLDLNGNQKEWTQEKNLARERANPLTTPTECRQSSPSTPTIKTPQNSVGPPCTVVAAVAAIIAQAEVRRTKTRTRPPKRSLRNLLPLKQHLMQRAKNERPNSAATNFTGAK